MKRKIDLFRLIQSMSKSEKRYFNLDAKKSGKKDAAYLQLFNAINKMDVYDETILRAKFKHLSVDKSYLYDAILASMRDYHSKKSRAAQIKDKLMDSKYLYERELYDLCEETLQEAKKLAEELEDYLSLLEINKQLRKIVKTTKTKDYAQRLEQLKTGKNQNLEAIEEEYEYLDLYDKIWKSSVQNVQLEEDKMEQFRLEISPLLERKQSGFKSQLAQQRFYQSNGFFYRMLAQGEKAFDFRYKAMKWWELNPKHKEEEFYNYVIDASNFLVSSFRLEKFDYFNDLIKQLENEKPSNAHHKKILFQYISQFKLFYNINFGLVDNIKEIEKEVNEGLSKFSVSQSKEKVLSLNIAVLFLIAEEFEDCIVWADKIIKASKINVRPDIDRGMYFIKLLSAYEVDDFELFDNTVRSAARFFNKDQDQYLSYYLQFLNLLKNLPNTPINYLKAYLKELKAFIDKMRSEIKGRVPLVGIDEMTIWWIDSKLQKKSIAEIVRSGRKAS